MNVLAHPHALVVALAVSAAAAMYYLSTQAAEIPDAGTSDAPDASPSLLGQLAQGYFTRGLRDNDPGNIRAGQGFVGEVGNDGGFAVFDDMAHGCRALCRVLDQYRDAHGLYTVADIIGRYAPTSENDTGSYVSDVSARLGVAPDAPIDTRDPTVMAQLIDAITRHENGYDPISNDVILQGISLARTGG